MKLHPIKPSHISTLRVGDKIQVAFGARGTQDARVVKLTKNGNVYVEKYRAASDSYTKPVRLYPADLKGIWF